MDQKRTLWIAIAAGLFLLVVIGAALFLYAPAAKKETSVATLGAKTTYIAPATIPTVPADSFAQSNPGDSFADSTTAHAADGSITSTENLTVIANGTTNVIGLGTTNTADASGTTTIDLNALKTVPATVTPQNQVAQDAMDKTSAAYAQSAPVAPVETAVQKAPTTPAKKQTAAKTTTTAKSNKTTTAKKTTTTTKIADAFWVQAASYSTKKNADEARDTLEANKIPCDVFTYKDTKGKLFYRVRVGPYTTKSEAEYWKERIVAIDLFAKSGSYVTNSSAPKK